MLLEITSGEGSCANTMAVAVFVAERELAHECQRDRWGRGKDRASTRIRFLKLQDFG
jgi:hypothetical protein